MYLTHEMWYGDTMRFTSLFILGFLVGCSGAPDTGGDSGGGLPASPDDPPAWSDTPGSGSGGPCSNAQEVQQLKLPDGGVVVIVVPIPCDPYWRDTGDPPPDREREQVVDPPPAELNVRPMEKYER